MRPAIYEVKVTGKRKPLATVTGPAKDKEEAGAAALAILRHIAGMQ